MKGSKIHAVETVNEDGTKVTHSLNMWKLVGDVYLCSICNSVASISLLEHIRAGGILLGPDWQYGVPHKFYLEGGTCNQQEFFIQHLRDLSDYEFGVLTKLVHESSDIVFIRRDGHIGYSAPFQGYQRIGAL